MAAKPQPHLGFGKMLTAMLRQLALQRPMKAVQADLAERLGYAPRTIYAWRKGELLPPSETVVEMARIFVQEGGADQEWLNAFLKRGEYGPVEAVIDLNRELFGQVDYAALGLDDQDEVNESESGAETYSIQPDKRAIQGNFFITALRRWSEDFFRWSEASDHMRSSWAGLAIHGLSAITDRFTPRGAMIFFITLALWMVTAQLITPALQWPLPDLEARRLAFVQYGIAMLLIPMLVTLVTTPDRYKEFQLETTKQYIVLWFLKFTGALVGFYVFAIVVLGVALIWYYLGRPAFDDEIVWGLALIPLFWSYVTARRIPADRYQMFCGNLQPHRADYLFLGAFFFFGPLTAVFIHTYYWFISDRMIFPPLVILLSIGIALGEYKKRDRSAFPDGVIILFWGGFIPLCIVFMAVFLIFDQSSQPFPTWEELPSLLLAATYFFSAFLLGATVFVRRKPILTLPGVFGLLAVCIIAYSALWFNIWLGRGMVLAVILLWVIWGQKRFRSYLWIHPSAGVLLIAFGTSFSLLVRELIPIWANLMAYLLITILLLRWAYRPSSEADLS